MATNALPDFNNQTSLISRCCGSFFSNSIVVVTGFAGGLIGIIGGLVLAGLFIPGVANFYYLVIGMVITRDYACLSLGIGYILFSVSFAILIIKNCSTPKEQMIPLKYYTALQQENASLRQPPAPTAVDDPDEEGYVNGSENSESWEENDVDNGEADPSIGTPTIIVEDFDITSFSSEEEEHSDTDHFLTPFSPPQTPLRNGLSPVKALDKLESHVTVNVQALLEENQRLNEENQRLKLQHPEYQHQNTFIPYKSSPFGKPPATPPNAPAPPPPVSTQTGRLNIRKRTQIETDATAPSAMANQYHDLLAELTKKFAKTRKVLTPTTTPETLKVRKRAKQNLRRQSAPLGKILFEQKTPSPTTTHSPSQTPLSVSESVTIHSPSKRHFSFNERRKLFEKFSQRSPLPISNHSK